MKEALGEKVEKVVVSTRLTDAPAVLTTEGAVSLKMAQMFNAQATASEERPEIHVVLEAQRQASGVRRAEGRLMLRATTTR